MRFIKQYQLHALISVVRSDTVDINSKGMTSNALHSRGGATSSALHSGDTMRAMHMLPTRVNAK